MMLTVVFYGDIMILRPLIFREEGVIVKKTILLSLVAGVLCFAIGFGSVTLAKTMKTPPAPAPVTPQVQNQARGITVTSGSFYPESSQLMPRVEQLMAALEAGTLTDALLTTELEGLIRQLEQLGFYYDYIGHTAATAPDGTRYGAAAGQLGPIGGGTGYGDIYTTGDFIVTDDNTFYAAAAKAQAGQVIFVPGDVEIDLSDLKYTEYHDLVLNPGVILASDRGLNGSSGGKLLISTAQTTIFTLSEGVRLTGLVIQGPDPHIHQDLVEYDPLDGIGVQGEGIRIDNCEISGFSNSGIRLLSGDLLVEYCYIHHIRGVGGGSGILAEGGTLDARCNLFSNCRSGITATAGCDALLAEENVEVGNGLESFFRLAPGEAPASQVPGMMASADSVTLRNNTVLGTTPLLALEGLPESLIVEQNLLALTEGQYDPMLHYGPEEFRDAIRCNILFRNNAYDPAAPLVHTWNAAIEQK